MSISTTTRTGSTSQGLTLASILGVKGPLRFRPHSASQKPHVVLRRVQIHDESSDEEEASNVVYFSLFASKRIEVKPGKEILLSVANADGSFDSQPILLAGDLSTGEEYEPTPMEEDLPALPEVIPPKMRRGWKARTDEELKPSEEVKAPPTIPPVVHSSIGIQAEPILSSCSTQTAVTSVSASVQVQPTTRPAAIQAQPKALDVALQADPVPYTSSTAQTVDTRLFASTDAQTDPPPPPPSRPLSISQLVPDARERSLSPMELDSPNSSHERSLSPVPSDHTPLVSASAPSIPNQPRTVLPTTPPLTMSPDSSQPSAIFSPHIRPHGSPARSSASLSRASSIASSSGAQDMQLSPVEPKDDSVNALVAERPISERITGVIDFSNSHSIDSTPHSTPPLGTSIKDAFVLKPKQKASEAKAAIALGMYLALHIALLFFLTPLLALPYVDGLRQEASVKAEESLDPIRPASLSPHRKRKRSLEQSISPPPATDSPSASLQATSSSYTKNLSQHAYPKATTPSPVRLSSSPPPPSTDTPSNTTTSRPLSHRPLSDLPKLSNFFVRATRPTTSLPEVSNSPLAPSSQRSAASAPSLESKQPTPAPAPAPPRPTPTPSPIPSFVNKSVSLTNSALPIPSSSPASSSPTPTYPSSSKIPIQPRLPPTQPQAMASRLRNGLAADARPFMNIPMGPMSNPLGIRPSVRPTASSANGFMNKAPPTAPKSIAQHSTLSAPKMPGSLKSLSQPSTQSPTSSAIGSNTMTSRKKIVVGNGWPLVRNVGTTPPQSEAPGTTVLGTNPHALGPPTPGDSWNFWGGPVPSSSWDPLGAPAPGPPWDVWGSDSIPPPPRLPLSPSEPDPEALYGPPPPPDNPPTAPAAMGKWRPVNGDKLSANQPQTPLVRSSRGHSSSDAPSSASPISPATPVSLTLPPGQPKANEKAINNEAPHSLVSQLKPPVGSPSPSILTQSLTRDDVSLKNSVLPIITTSNLESHSKTPTTKKPSSTVNGSAKTPVMPSPSPKISHPSIPLPLTHPLPPKPVGVVNTPSARPRGLKRERDSPEIDLHKKRRRTFRWPAVEPLRSVKLKGDGDLGIKKIAFNSDGSQFALCCSDRTVRIWSNQSHAELARLTHNAPVVSVFWLTGDAGVVTLSEDGVVSKWIKTGPNHWQWAKILDAGNDRRPDDDPICLAYRGDRLAVSFPRLGVKVWIWAKGTWQPQRSIVRQNVTAIQFVDDGEALLGGTKDGVLWYCAVPNGTLRAYSFLRTKITQIDIGIGATQALVAQSSGCCRLVGLQQNIATVEQAFSVKDLELRTEFGALFAAKDQAVLFGDVEGCLPVWDKKKATIVYGLDHGEDALVQAVASFASSPNKEIVPCIITGTKQGQLCWWSQPASSSQAAADESARKRLKATT